MHVLFQRLQNAWCCPLMSRRETLCISMRVVHCRRFIAQVVNDHYLSTCRLECFLQKAPVHSIWTSVAEIDFSEKRSFLWQLPCSILSPPVAIGSPVICTEKVNRQAEDEILLGSSLFSHTSHTVITRLLL